MPTTPMANSRRGFPQDRAPGEARDHGGDASDSVTPACAFTARWPGLSPEMLKRLTTSELMRLAGDIREFLVQSVARTGGHIGANLGVVELSIAIHRVFSSPAEPVVWDTGHQSYVHKILTGRAERFSALRQTGGLSGYPNRQESEHDWIENSHASAALGYVHGLAVADGGHRPVVAVIGDGALTGGLAYEGLANIGMTDLPVVVILNDNGRSYAPTHSRLCSPSIDETPDSTRMFFESLGIEYAGPVDGHSLDDLISALESARCFARPILVHVITRKGEGYGPASRDDSKRMHDSPRFEVQTGSPLDPPRPTFTDDFERALVALGATDERVCAITAAMRDSTGLRSFASRYPQRFFDVGIAEGHAALLAAGLALGGLRPVVAIFSPFLFRALDVLVFDIALRNLPVTICVDRAGINGPDGSSYSGAHDVPALRGIPNLLVLAPRTVADVAEMLEHAVERGGPTVIRWPKAVPADVPRLVGRAPNLPIDLAIDGVEVVVRGRGTSTVAVSYGPIATDLAAAATELLAEHLPTPTVLAIRAVHPVSRRALDELARYSAILVVEDCLEGRGIAEELRTALPRRLIDAVGVPFAFLAHGDPQDVRQTAGLDTGSLRRRLLDLALRHSAGA